MLGSLVFLFLAVWLPCCISDIVFPLLLIGEPTLDNHSKVHQNPYPQEHANA
jgi:hypothetical protein